jgi:uncharacterized protein (DUF1800 family)
MGSPALGPELAASLAVTRFGLGARPGELGKVKADPQGWLLAQIRREGAETPLALDGTPFKATPERFAEFRAYREAIKAAGADEAARKAAREPYNAIIADEMLGRVRLGCLTDSGFRERWSLFWLNHFTVSAVKGEEAAALVSAFDREAIRPNVFSSFEHLLLASSRHPAMLLYLDQAQSAGPNSQAGLRRHAGLNENLAREIMELHTLGADAGYSQADVTEFARALTGWSVGRNGAFGEREGYFMFRPQQHEPGRRQVFGHHYGDGGEEQARYILLELANHPKTARRLAFKIATHFVADQPPQSLVDRLEKRFRDTQGDLAELARTLVTSPEAWSQEAAKFKTPDEFLVSAYRAAGQTPIFAPREVIQPLTQLGQRPYSAPQPNGWPDVAAAWAAPGAMIKRLEWAEAFAYAYAPQTALPDAVALEALGARLRPNTLAAIHRAESRKEGFAVLLMSPEFQRR